MPGLAGAIDDALEQALQAQLAPHAYADGWRCRYAPYAPSAAQEEASAASRRTVPARAATAADGAAQAAQPGQAARSKPVAPALKPEERKAGRLKALQLAAARKELREQLQKSQITLEQALARDDEAARGMRTQTLLRALPGIGGATAGRLMAAAGIDPSRRAGALTAGQRERLVAAVAAVGAELAARHGHRVTIPASVRDVPRPRRGGGAVPRAVLAHPAPGQIRSARSSGGPRR
jgi:S13-like H2TH domain